MDADGEVQPKGTLTLRKMRTADLERAIREATPRMDFERAWVTARMEEDGNVRTVVHALAYYSDPWDPSLTHSCTVAFDVEADAVVQKAFEQILTENMAEAARRVVKDAATSFVAKQQREPGGDE